MNRAPNLDHEIEGHVGVNYFIARRISCLQFGTSFPAIFVIRQLKSDPHTPIADQNASALIDII
jgi:hypothetical protein